MKYKQAIIGAFVALLIMGTLDRWTQRGRISINPHDVKVGRVSVRAVDAISKERLWPTVNFGAPSQSRLFRYSVSAEEDGCVVFLYATDYDPTISIGIEGYETQIVPLSSLNGRYVASLVKLKK